MISTHTLTWSVTPCLQTPSPQPVHFNSHAHVERDLIPNCGIEILDISTHTLTWSVTNAVESVVGGADFNSHAHVERDDCRHKIQI